MKYLITFIAASMIGYYGFLYEFPYIVQRIAETRFGKPNRLIAKGIVTDTSRSVVAPNPDFLYSAASFDLAAGPLRLSGTLPDSTYFSLSFYQKNTSNFYVINDRNLSKNFDIVLVEKGKPAPKTNAQIVFSPSVKGTALVRILWYDQKQLPALIAIQKAIKFERF